MKKAVIYSSFVLMLLIASLNKSNAQIVVRWEELYREWHINSAAYPPEEPELDSLYNELSYFKLIIKPDNTYNMFITKQNVESGTIEINKAKKEIIFVNKANGKKMAYSVGELTADYLVLSIGEKYTWLYYLSLTSHF